MMAGQAPAYSEPDKGEVSEKTSVFIPRESLGGKECKAGEKLTFTVKDVDVETGEVEAEFAGYDGESEAPNQSGTAEAIDSMPDE